MEADASATLTMTRGDEAVAPPMMALAIVNLFVAAACTSAAYAENATMKDPPPSTKLLLGIAKLNTAADVKLLGPMTMDAGDAVGLGAPPGRIDEALPNAGTTRTYPDGRRASLTDTIEAGEPSLTARVGLVTNVRPGESSSTIDTIATGRVRMVDAGASPPGRV
jgi:hypothetical protein